MAVASALQPTVTTVHNPVTPPKTKEEFSTLWAEYVIDAIEGHPNPAMFEVLCEAKPKLIPGYNIDEVPGPLSNKHFVGTTNTAGLAHYTNLEGISHGVINEAFKQFNYGDSCIPLLNFLAITDDYSEVTTLFNIGRCLEYRMHWKLAKRYFELARDYWSRTGRHSETTASKAAAERIEHCNQEIAYRERKHND